MRKYVLLVPLIFMLQNCTSRHKKETSNVTELEYDSSETFDSAEVNEEYSSYYGFVVKNSTKHNFYNVDRDIMLKYISDASIDSTNIKNDILSSSWFSRIRGASYDYFCWLNFIEESSIIYDSLEFETCNKKVKSQIIPVYITQFNRRLNNTKSKLGACNNEFVTEIYEQSGLNVVYIIPLNYEKANSFLDIKDTLDRNKYKNFIKNKIH